MVVGGRLSILLTGAGAPGTRGTLYAIRNNPEGRPIHVVGTDLRSEGVGRLWMDAFYQVTAPEDEGYLETLLAICQKEAVELVIPQTTREIAALAQQKERFEAAGIRVMVSDAQAIQVANNKWELLKLFAKLNRPHPAFHLARSRDELVEYAARLGYPHERVVVKPPISNGTRGFRILREGAWDLERFLNDKPSGVEIALEELLTILGRGSAWPELLVTEHLPGAEYSVDGFLGAKVQVAVPRLRQEIRSGISFVNHLEYRADLIEATLAVGKEIGLTHAFGFQFKLDRHGRPKVLECNPRLQGTMVASLFSGVNLIWMGVKEALGEPPDTVPTRLRKASFYRFWGGIGIDGEQIHEI